jgi:hypothetical protein
VLDPQVEGADKRFFSLGGAIVVKARESEYATQGHHAIRLIT